MAIFPLEMAVATGFPFQGSRGSSWTATVKPGAWGYDGSAPHPAIYAIIQATGGCCPAFPAYALVTAQFGRYATEMIIRILGKEGIDEIRTLWEGLNSLHARISPDFTQYYQAFSFGNRKEELLRKRNLKIFVASESDSDIGYCVASVDADVGEIDSLFVLPEFRNRKIGHGLMEVALEWLQEQKCIQIDLIVAAGNEEVFPFYEKYGFKKRATIMRKARQPAAPDR